MPPSPASTPSFRGHIRKKHACVERRLLVVAGDAELFLALLQAWLTSASTRRCSRPDLRVFRAQISPNARPLPPPPKCEPPPSNSSRAARKLCPCGSVPQTKRAVLRFREGGGRRARGSRLNPSSRKSQDGAAAGASKLICRRCGGSLAARQLSRARRSGAATAACQPSCFTGG
jgi:hypothetical protein